MLALDFAPMFALAAQFGRQPGAPLRLFLRTTGHKLRPPAPVDFHPVVRRRQDGVVGAGAGLHQLARLQVEARPGPLPTVVVGGFVPDATEAVYLLRGQLLRHGGVYYVNYPRRGFSLDLFVAQLEDLIEELAAGGRPPVVLAVSWGAALVREMLRRAAIRGERLPLAGLCLVSPVACLGDLIDPAEPKPTTLLGRVLRPFLATDAEPDRAVIDRARNVFLKMFEAGAVNKEALWMLLTREETDRLRDAVLATINAIEPRGAFERVSELRRLPEWSGPRPLFAGPALALYSEKESAVIVENSPTARILRGPELRAWFPHGRCLTVSNPGGSPVQHASLIFHSRNFQPPLAGFYRQLRLHRQRHAA